MASLKIKVKPEDFIVTETATLPLRSTGAYGLYRLTKSGWNTVELIQVLSRKLNLPLSSFAWGGRKDRHALTTQYISIKKNRPLAVTGKDYTLEFVGFTDRPMGPDAIDGNSFEVTVRDLTPGQVESACREIGRVGSAGYLNYYDDQRFGSFDEQQGFFAEKIIRAHYSGALKIHLTAVHSCDTAHDRRRRELFIRHWKQWQHCLAQAQTGFEKKVFAYLLSHPAGFLPVLRMIPREDLSIYFSAYQSYLWNEIMRAAMAQIVTAPLTKYPGVAGDYIFYTALKGHQRQQLFDLCIPTPAAKVILPQPPLDKVYMRVLETHGIKLSLFGKIRLRRAYFKSFLRRAVVFPGNISLETSRDDIYRGGHKLVLKFLLPRGSFATMFLKRIFSTSR